MSRPSRRASAVALAAALIAVGACGADVPRPEASMGASAAVHQSSGTLHPQDSSTWLPDLDALNESIPSDRCTAGPAAAGSSIRVQKVDGTGHVWPPPPGWDDTILSLT